MTFMTPCVLTSSYSIFIEMLMDLISYSSSVRNKELAHVSKHAFSPGNNSNTIHLIEDHLM